MADESKYFQCFTLVNVPENGHVTPTDFVLGKKEASFREMDFTLGHTAIGPEDHMRNRNHLPRQATLARIKTIVFPNGLEHIRHEIYLQMVSVTHMVLPPTLKTIAAYAFVNCYNLEELIIPSSFTLAESQAFYFDQEPVISRDPVLKRVIVQGWREHPAFSRIYHPNMFYGYGGSRALNKVEVVDAPTSVVKLLNFGGVCMGYNKYKDLPEDVRLAGQAFSSSSACKYYWPEAVGTPSQAIEYYFWNSQTHATSCLPEAKKCVETVLLVGERHAADGGGGDSISDVPPEVWMLILSFVAKVDFGPR